MCLDDIDREMAKQNNAMNYIHQLINLLTRWEVYCELCSRVLIPKSCGKLSEIIEH